MSHTALPDHLTKVSYILTKTAKRKLEKYARKHDLTLSAVITEALEQTAFQVARSESGRAR